MVNGLLYLPMGLVNAWAVVAVRRRFAVAGGRVRAPLVRTGDPELDKGITRRQVLLSSAACWAAVAIMVGSIFFGALFNSTAINSASWIISALSVDSFLSIILVYTPLLVAVPSVFAIDSARAVTASGAILAALRAAEPQLRPSPDGDAAFHVATAGERSATASAEMV